MAWMPTLSADTQAVLAGDRVLFQGQEVAFVVADDRYSARDALELIEVEYEPLPVVMSARDALADGATPVRDDGNHVFDWEAGDRAATDAAFARAEVVVAQDMVFPRSHPAPMETCGAIAAYDRVEGKLTLWCTTQAPHAHRTLYSLITGLPEHRIRVVSPDVGGGFGNKVPVYPGYVCAMAGVDAARPARQVGRGPVREPDVDRLRARLRDARADRGVARRAHPGVGCGRVRRPRRVQRDRAADPLSGRVLLRLHRLLRRRGRALPRDRRVHQQGAGRRGLRVLVPDRRGGVSGGAAGGLPRARAGGRSGGVAAAEPDPPRAVPVRVEDRLGVRLGRVRGGAGRGAAARGLRRAAGRAGARSAVAAS